MSDLADHFFSFRVPSETNVYDPNESEAGELAMKRLGDFARDSLIGGDVAEHALQKLDDWVNDECLESGPALRAFAEQIRRAVAEAGYVRKIDAECAVEAEPFATHVTTVVHTHEPAPVTDLETECLAIASRAIGLMDEGAQSRALDYLDARFGL